MKFHFYTKDTSNYSFDSIIEIMGDEEFESLIGKESIEKILNSDDVIDEIRDYDWDELVENIESLFDMTNDGEFDWNDKTGEYYDFFDKMLHDLICSLEKSDGIVIASYSCELSDEGSSFSNSTLSLYIPNFYCGNGEPVGAQLALNMVECFMKANQWNVGFYDANNVLITDIPAWAKNNMLDIRTIKPIIWFGKNDFIPKCWSITSETSDLFIKQFWGDYYEGALPYICKADDGIGIYYSVWEYGLYYDESIFYNIKSQCPINLNLVNEERANALFNLVASIYNDNKGADFPFVDKDLYLQDVLECRIIVSCPNFNYSYSKPYKFNFMKLEYLNNDIIEDILREDEAYHNSFYYLKDIIINKCDLSSHQDVWKTVEKVVSIIQDDLNNSLICQIIKDDKVLTSVPFVIDLKSKLPLSEIKNIVFIKSLIEFLKRGTWQIGYRNASLLPVIYNAYAQKIPQEGTYPIVWFNDTDEIIGKLGIWPAHEQYMLSLVWKNVSSFCSTVFNNIDVHNKFQGSSLYNELEVEFERIKADCPIQIHSGDNPIDFNELKQLVERTCNYDDTGIV